MITDLLILLLLILANGVLASSELAMLTVNENRHRYNLKGEKKNKQFDILMKDAARFLATIQIGITFIGLFSGAFAATAYSGILTDLVLARFPSLDAAATKQVITIAITLLLTYFSIVIGELVPKKMAIRFSEKITSATIGIVSFISIVVRPFVSLLTASTNLVFKIFRIDPNERENIEAEFEIKKLLEARNEGTSIDKSEINMINNVFEFDNISVDEICTHRKDIVALDISSSKYEIIEIVAHERYSRIPVFEDNIDNIIGILHIRDFLNYIISPENYLLENVDLSSLIRKPCFVPISKKTDELFEEMKKSRVHMAIVVDEYGGTAGLVTMEDLIENIMGSILDEYDAQETPEIEQLDSGAFIISGIADLGEVSDYLGVKLPEEDYDTLSGFVIGQIGRIPEADEKPEFDFEGISFKVLSVDDKRIKNVIATKL